MYRVYLGLCVPKKPRCTLYVLFLYVKGGIMSVIRINKNKDYTVMSNYHFKEKNMSLKAKGLLSEMLSLPDNWDYSISGLVAINKENESAIKSTLDELKEFGYLIITKKMPNETKSGRIEYIYDIFEESQKQEYKKQGVENLGVEFQQVENQVQYNTNNKILNNKVFNNKNNTTTDTIYDFLQENGFVLAPIQCEVVDTWEDNELTRHAIKQAVLNNKFNINYIDKIIYSYKKDNIKTVQQAIEREEEFNNKRDNYYKNKYEHKESRYEETQRKIEEWLKDE